MATANLSNLSNLISVEECLNTTYRPDVDYVDGEIEQRNVGEFDHGDLQAAICTALGLPQKDWGVRVVVDAHPGLADALSNPRRLRPIRRS